MIKAVILLVGAAIAPLCAQSIFISEFHYDNFQADTNEFVEVTSWAQNDLSCYQLLYVNGGATPPVVYKTINLKDSLVPLQQSGYGTLLITNSKKDQIQNGPKDGFLLYDSCHKTTVQYISYEGIIPAITPFTELPSIDLGVAQTAENDSISLQASKTEDAQILTWSKGKSSPGTLNSSILWNTAAQGVVKGNVYLATENCQSSASVQASVTLYDGLGSAIFSVLAHHDGSFAIHHVPNGLYFLKINAPEGYQWQNGASFSKIIVLGDEKSYNFCLEKVITEVQNSNMQTEVTVAISGNKVEVQSPTAIRQVELYSLSGQKEVFYGSRFESLLHGTLIMCIISEDGVFRRKIVLD